jgi:hypothetical protein
MANLIRVKQLDQPDLSGFFNTAFINTGIIDATYVDKFTDENISGVKTFIDGVNLNNIDNLSFSGVDITITSGSVVLTNRPTVNGTGVLLSGEAARLPTTIVYTTGNQNISGTKNFYTRPTVNGTGVLLSGERPTVNGTGVLLSGEVPTLPPTIVYTTGDQTISGIKTFLDDLNISGDLTLNGGLYINDIEELNLSGANIYADNLVYNIGNQTISGVKTFDLQPILSGNPLITGNLSLYATTTNLASTGNTLTTNLASTGNTLTTNLASTGSTLVNRINSLSGTLTGNYGTITNLASTGSTLVNRIDSLSGSAVLITGNQTISGIKTFTTGVNISGHVGIGIDSNNFDLYVRKSRAGVSVSPHTNSIAVFEGSGNSHINILASDAQTASVILGSPADPLGSYLSWNHDNNELKLATANPDGFIQFSTDIEVQAVRITSAGNVGIGTIAPSEKLEVTGNIKASGASFINRPTVNGTGVLLSGQNTFVLPFSNTTETAAPNSIYYFSNLAYTLRTDNTQAKTIALDDFVARKASWTTHVSSFTPATTSTGYFYNFTKNTSGIISEVIKLTVKDVVYNYGGILNPPIAVSINDEIGIALKTGPTLNNQGHSGMRNSVNVYCYN